MKINIYGMGYVGCVSAACLANSGNNVTGIDVNHLKVKIINDGKSPIIEPRLQEVIKRAIDSKKLRATVDDIGQAHISIVCVGTPSNENGSLQLHYISKVAEQIGHYLKHINSYHVVNIRSTVLPGTVEEVVIPLIEQRSMKKAGPDFGICMNPEFMREGTSVSDFYNPPFTLIGELDKKSGDVISELYEGVKAPIIRTNIKVAETVKYVCNTFHALKISFVNEIGNICKKLNIDSHEVMDIFCQDTKLNLSPYYLKPGFAFGGSCLPKDLRALLHKAKELDLEIPVLNSILKSNQNQIDVAYNLINKTRKKKVGILGLSFKPGSDDLRESPIVNLIERLIGKGYKISIYDEEVSLAKIFGANKRYIERSIPHIASLMKQSIEDVLQHSQVIVVAKNSKEIKDIIARLTNKIILDLVRISEKPNKRNSDYEGICW
jgi:GDP-mannose 6-dehydrogenase